MKKLLSLDALSFNSTIQVGSHKYAQLFNNNFYGVFSISDLLNIYKFKRKNSEDRELIENWKKGVQKSKEGIFYYTPFCLLPYLNFPLLDNIKLAENCSKYCSPDLKKILQRYKFSDVDIVFINNIRLFSVLKFIRAKLKILRVSDRIEYFNNQPRTILNLQNKVIKNSDIIFATSHNLQRDISKIHSKCFHLPNGIDNNFIMKESENFTLPDDFKKIRKPIILYVGAISDWFDYELYEYGLKNLQNFSFVMIGHISGVNYSKNLSMVEKFRKNYNNFFFLGPKKHSDLKQYLAHSDIGIIPFLINPLTNDINPVKLFEYAGFGLPIVASNMTELYNYKEFVSLYTDKKQYISLITDCLNKINDIKNKLISFAHNNTWEKRFDFIISIIDSLYKEKSNE